MVSWKVMINIKKIIAIFIIVLSFTCILSWIYLEYDYAFHRIQKAQPELGRIYPHNVHGTIVYLTQQEDLQLKYLFLSFGILFILMLIFLICWGDPFHPDK